MKGRRDAPFFMRYREIAQGNCRAGIYRGDL